MELVGDNLPQGFKTGCSLSYPELHVQLFPGEEGKVSNFSKQFNFFLIQDIVQLQFG